ncbi:unnamed protein product [Nippostrongylus brasiliensis]|uniref:Uncharacterized protein n=1 Tax=Nippostrongylus brasiliensis TaxID=27835 RepID=A0A158QY76_NIPBR|nr:unnamed protein product [Nippostrongylus brasiliensis]
MPWTAMFEDELPGDDDEVDSGFVDVVEEYSTVVVDKGSVVDPLAERAGCVEVLDSEVAVTVDVLPECSNQVFGNRLEKNSGPLATKEFLNGLNVDDPWLVVLVAEVEIAGEDDVEVDTGVLVGAKTEKYQRPAVAVVVDDPWLEVIVVEVETTGEEDAEVGLVVLVEEELAVVPRLEVETTGDDDIEVDPVVVLVGEELAVVPILVVVVGEGDVDFVWTFVLDVDDRGRVVDDALEVVRDVVVETTGDDAIEVDPVVLVEELTVVPTLVEVVGEGDVDFVWTFVLDVDDRGRVVVDALEVVRDVVVG